MDLTVVHSHLSDSEAEEISAFIQQYKATHGKAPAALKVEVTEKKTSISSSPCSNASI